MPDWKKLMGPLSRQNSGSIETAGLDAPEGSLVSSLNDYDTRYSQNISNATGSTAPSLDLGTGTRGFIAHCRTLHPESDIYLAIGDLDAVWRPAPAIRDVLAFIHKDCYEKLVKLLGFESEELTGDVEAAESGIAVLHLSDDDLIITTNHNLTRLAYHLDKSGRKMPAHYTLRTGLHQDFAPLKVTKLQYLPASATPSSINIPHPMDQSSGLSMREQLAAYANSMSHDMINYNGWNPGYDASNRM